MCKIHLANTSTYDRKGGTSNLVDDKTTLTSPPSAAYMRRWTGSALAQVNACRLFGAKTLLEPMLIFFVNGTLRNEFQWISNQNAKNVIHKNECIRKHRLGNGRHFVHGGDELMPTGSISIYQYCRVWYSRLILYIVHMGYSITYPLPLNSNISYWKI